MAYKKTATGFQRNAGTDINPLLKEPNKLLGGYKIYADRTALYSEHPAFLDIAKTLIYIVDRGDGLPEFLEVSSLPGVIPGSAPYTDASNFTISSLLASVGILAIQQNAVTEPYQPNLNFTGTHFTVNENVGNTSIDIALVLTESHITDLGTTVTLNADTDATTKGWVIDEDNMISDSAIKVPTQQSVKAYVDGRVASQINYKGSYDAATNIPDLDSAPSGVLLGDMYTVTVAGVFFTANVEAGDVLIAEVDSAAAETHWTIVQKNLDAPSVKALYESNTAFNLTNGPVTAVDITTTDLTVDHLQFDTTITPSATNPGLLEWNEAEDTLDLHLRNTVVTQIGQEINPLVRNATGSTITNGTPVRFSGTTGASGRVNVAPMIADGTVLSSYVLGLATQDISNGQDGHVTWFGKVRGIDTTGTPYGETWADEDLVYVSPTTAGDLTNVKPSAPDQQIFIGVVVNAHATQGTIFVRTSWRGNVHDIDDVNGTPLTTTGQIMVWDNTAEYFDFTSNISDFALASHTHTSVDITDFDEAAQDAVGTILTDTAEIDFTYNDGTPSIVASIVTGSIDVLKLDAGVQASLALADSAIQTELNDLSSNVTWVNVPDANITESSVTQHEAALSVAASQITAGTFGAGTYVISGQLDVDNLTFNANQILNSTGAVQIESVQILSSTIQTSTTTALNFQSGSTGDVNMNFTATGNGNFIFNAGGTGTLQTNATHTSNISGANDVVTKGYADSNYATDSHTHTLSDVTDVTASVAEVNLLDLSGLTAGWVLRASGATTATWTQLAGSDINNDQGWTNNTGTVTSVAISGTDGIQVDSGSPITTAGTIQLGLDYGTIDHDQLLNFVASEHIDWTNATDALTTTGSIFGGPIIGSKGNGTNGQGRLYLYEAANNGTSFIQITVPSSIASTKTITLPDATGTMALTSDITAEVNDLSSAVTWVNVPDGNITQTSVTQHEAAIDHDALTNYISGEHFLQSAITTVGTIGTGVWQGTAIDQTYLVGQSGTNTGDQTSIVGITGTKAQFDIAVTDGNFMYIGDAPTSHTHLIADITDFTDNSTTWDALVSNVSTTLSTGTVTATTYGITSDGGADDIILVEATTSTAGLLGADKWDEIVANTAKVTFPGFTSLAADYSFTDNSSNWDTAFGWGDHSGLYSLLAHTHLLAAGATDVTATAAEVNVLDLSVTSLTIGWGYFADGVSSASWRQLLGSEISNTESWTSNTGTVTEVTVSTGLDVATGTTTPLISLDLAEFVDMTATMVGTDQFIVLDGANQRRKAANEIGLSIFNDDLGHVENVVGNLGFTAGTGEITTTNGTNITVGSFGTANTNYGFVVGSNSLGATYYLDGSGAWSIPTGGIGGSIADTQVAFGSGTDIAGDADLIFTSASHILSVGTIANTGAIRVADGSAATPAFSFGTATTTGIYKSGAAMGFSVGGSQKFAVDTTNFTIGVSVEINNNLTVQDDLNFDGNGSVIIPDAPTGTTTGLLRYDNASSGILEVYDAGWQTVGGGGATLSGSTANALVSVTGANALTEETNLTYNGTNELAYYYAVNDGNPSLFMGSSATDRLQIQSVYDSVAQDLNYVQFTGLTSDVAPHRGRFLFYPGGTLTVEFNDYGINSQLIGSVTQTSIKINGDDNTGLYSTGGDVLNVAAGGNEVVRFATAQLSIYQDTVMQSGTTLSAQAGSSSLPSIHFGTDTNTGIYRPGADIFGIAAGGVEGLTVTEVGSAITVDVNGALTADSYDGVLAANLLDKTAAETVSGSYTFSGQINNHRTSTGSQDFTQWNNTTDSVELSLYYDGTNNQFALFNANNGAGTRYMTFEDATGGVIVEQAMFINERASALADNAGEGQIWVKDDAPNVPMYTDDAGTDFEVMCREVYQVETVGTATDTVDIPLDEDTHDYLIIKVTASDLDSGTIGGASGSWRAWNLHMLAGRITTGSAAIITQAAHDGTQDADNALASQGASNSFGNFGVTAAANGNNIRITVDPVNAGAGLDLRWRVFVTHHKTPLAP